jgi:hypothetical protein
MKRRQPIAKSPSPARQACPLRVLDAYRLYQLAVRCRTKALGYPCNKPFVLGHWLCQVDRRTFILLAVELHRRGWRPHWHN